MSNNSNDNSNPPEQRDPNLYYNPKQDVDDGRPAWRKAPRRRITKTGRSRKDRGNHYFNRLAETEEGRAKLREWRMKGARTNPGKRKGVPSHMTIKEFEALYLPAKAEAKKIVDLMEQKKLVENEYAREALEFSVGVVRAGAHTIKDRLSAAKLVLDFTKQKPAAKNEVTISKAEDFLAQLAEEAASSEDNAEGNGS